MNDNNDDDDDMKRPHDEPLHHHPSQTLTRREKALLAGMSTELPKPKSDLVEHSSPKARVGGRVYLHSPVPGIAQLITTSPSVQNILGPQPDCSSRIIKAQVLVVLPTCPIQWPMYKSTTDVAIDCVDCVTSTYEEQDRVTIPAAKCNIDPSNCPPNAEMELCRSSKTTETELCRFSKFNFGHRCCNSRDCHSANSGNYRSAKSTAAANVHFCHRYSARRRV